MSDRIHTHVKGVACEGDGQGHSLGVEEIEAACEASCDETGLRGQEPPISAQITVSVPKAHSATFPRHKSPSQRESNNASLSQGPSAKGPKLFTPLFKNKQTKYDLFELQITEKETKYDLFIYLSYRLQREKK